MTRFILLFMIALASPAPANAARDDLGWTSYRNERYGFSFSYPAAVFAFDRASERDDGLAFESPDGGAKLLAGAFQNDDGHTVESYRRYIANKSYGGAGVDYAPRGRNWFVLSGERDGGMYYEKVMFSCGGALINSFALVYPVAERGFYDPIVERMENSFRPGSGCE